MRRWGHTPGITVLRYQSEKQRECVWKVPAVEAIENRIKSLTRSQTVAKFKSPMRQDVSFDLYPSLWFTGACIPASATEPSIYVIVQASPMLR